MAQVIRETQEAREEHGLNWKAAVWGGVIAGLVFMMMEMILVATVGGGSLWGPPRMMAAMIMGEGVLPPPATFSMGIMMVAMIVHFPLSIIYGFVLGWFIKRQGTGLAVLSGAVFGAVIYVLNFYIIAPVMFPWFEMAQNWITAISHITFGAVLGWIYKLIEHRTSH